MGPEPVGGALCHASSLFPKRRAMRSLHVGLIIFAAVFGKHKHDWWAVLKGSRKQEGSSPKFGLLKRAMDSCKGPGGIL